MKLLIAHLPADAFVSARTELADLGVLRVTVSEVHSTSARPTITLRYRGAPLKTELRAELRLECVSTEGQAPAIIDILREHAGRTGQVAVIDIEELHRPCSDEPAFAADPRLESVGR